MNEITLIGIIAIGVLGIMYFVFNIGKTSKGENQTDTNKSSIVNNQAKKNTGYKKNNKELPKSDMFEFMEFDKITDDMIIQNKGNKFTMIIQCKGINYDLMSQVEQLAVEEGFIMFLNTLKYPIQIYVQARTIDLKTSLDMYKSKVSEINKEFEQKSTLLSKVVKDRNSTEEEIEKANVEKEKIANISEYAQDITRYVERLSLNKHMLQRKFYVIISYYKSEISSTNTFSEDEVNDICYRELYTRAQGVISSLQSCSVNGRVLTSNEIAELLYISYNRDDEKLIDIKTALESGFYRMYSTTRDINEKRRELLDKQVQEEAYERVKEAIDEAIRTGVLKTKDELVEEFENETDVAAINMVESLDINNSQKAAIEKVIIEKHNAGVDDREEKRNKDMQKRIENLTEDEIEKISKDIEKAYVSQNEENDEENNEENDEKKLNINNSKIDIIN